MTVLVSDTKVIDIEIEREVFGAAGVEVARTDADTPDALIEDARAAGAEAMIVDAGTPVTAEVVAALPSLRVVGRSGIGVDNIAVRAAADAGVTVVNVPDYGVDEVSTHALSLALACWRRLGPLYRSVRDGEWDWSVAEPVPRLAGSTVGLVAFGKIARRVAAKLRGFDVDVLAYDPYVPGYRMADLGVEKVGFDDLLSVSDLVSIHAPLTDETRGLFDAEAFDSMREGAILVNTARGPIVEESALHDALAAGDLAGAGLDVFESEPPGDSPLLGREDVLVSPHAAWYSEASRVDLSRGVAEDVLRVLDGESPENPVDPESGWF